MHLKPPEIKCEIILKIGVMRVNRLQSITDLKKIMSRSNWYGPPYLLYRRNIKSQYPLPNGIFHFLLKGVMVFIDEVITWTETIEEQVNSIELESW